MGNSVFTPEIASQYGALDDTAIADGGPASAHAARTLAMSTHRLLAMGEPMLSLMFDASDDGGGSGGLSARGYLNGYALNSQWRRLFPAPLVVAKKTTHRRAEMRIVANIQNAGTVLIQVVTNGCRYNNDAIATSPNVLPMVGTGSFHTYILAADNTDHPQLLLGSYPAESIELYIKGSLDTPDLIDTSTYGAPNTGTALLRLPLYGTTTSHFSVSGGAWNVPPATTLADGSVFVKFHQSSNPDQLLVAPRPITSIASVNTLGFLPPMTTSEVQLCEGSTFTLHHAPAYRIASISINTADLNG